MNTTVTNETRGEARVSTLASALRTPRRLAKHEIGETLERVVAQQNKLMKQVESLTLNQVDVAKSSAELENLINLIQSMTRMTEANLKTLSKQKDTSASSEIFNSTIHQSSLAELESSPRAWVYIPTKIATMLCGATALGLISAGIAPSSISIFVIAAVLGGVLGWVNVFKIGESKGMNS